jgi:RimJ/RimL family protein N-acetyltransferase
MRELEKSQYAMVYKLYCAQEAFFPVIAAVLLDKQDGVVYADNVISPARIYVEHSFGFAQIFGSENHSFDEELEKYLVLTKSFHAPKVRLWTPVEPAFMRSSKFDAHRSERQRFVLGESTSRSRAADAVGSDATRPLRGEEIAVVDNRFQLMGRFWRNEDKFLSEAYAVVAWKDSKPAAICYAAAIADSQAEIDVMTAPEFRRSGLGREVVECFNRRLLDAGFRPVWDCFTNNEGSMALCRSTGFTPVRPPYPFYTFNK